MITFALPYTTDYEKGVPNIRTRLAFIASERVVLMTSS